MIIFYYQNYFLYKFRCYLNLYQFLYNYSLNYFLFYILIKNSYIKKFLIFVIIKKKQMNSHILDRSDALNFIFAGNSIFTFLNTKTNNRFTYKVKKSKNSRYFLCICSYFTRCVYLYWIS